MTAHKNRKAIVRPEWSRLAPGQAEAGWSALAIFCLRAWLPPGCGAGGAWG